MSNSSQISDIIKGGGFSAHYYVGRLFKVGFAAQCVFISAVFAGLIVAGSFQDGTLILDGRDVGLLEHPAIWAFLGLQIALPLWLRRSLEKIRTIGEFSDELVAFLRKFLRLQDAGSRLGMAICYVIGLVAFVWNTYQNQLPGIVVPYDFWDSSNHIFGYWITRVYKFYLFVWLFPYIALVTLGSCMLRSAR